MQTTPDAQDLAKMLAAVVRDHVGAAFAVLSERIATLERREPLNGEKGDRGEAGERGERGEPGEKGEKGDAGERGEKGDRGDPGVHGEKGDRGDVGPPGPAGDAGARGEKGEAGDKGERGQEGPEGKQGRDGRDGLNGLQGERGDRGTDGKDGRDGVDGKDGLGFDELEVEHDGRRTFTLRCRSGERVKDLGTFVIPAMIDAGVYRLGEQYQKGDAVTFSGSLFIAQQDTDAKPETGPEWRLAVKRGRDGKDGKPGERGERGPAGPRAEVARAY